MEMRSINLETSCPMRVQHGMPFSLVSISPLRNFLMYGRCLHRLVIQDLRVRKETWDHKDTKATWVLKDTKAIWDHKATKGHKDTKAIWDHKATKGRKDTKGRKVQRV